MGHVGGVRLSTPPSRQWSAPRDCTALLCVTSVRKIFPAQICSRWKTYSYKFSISGVVEVVYRTRDETFTV